MEFEKARKRFSRGDIENAYVVVNSHRPPRGTVYLVYKPGKELLEIMIDYKAILGPDGHQHTELKDNISIRFNDELKHGDYYVPDWVTSHANETLSKYSEEVYRSDGVYPDWGNRGAIAFGKPKGANDNWVPGQG